ncbi:hypothetical protein FB645_002893 [Coemansia sp. IMI 203386]|nr:hypothetical protein FB645_002893 [Coemansia sp. IMI 203386]
MAANPTFGKYVVRALALGLDVDQAARRDPGEKTERRPSLTQRLGLGSAASPKGKDKEADAAASSGNDEGSDSRPQKEHGHRGARKRPGKIECVDVVGSDVYVGTSNGHVLHYAVDAVTMETQAAPAIRMVQAADVGAGSGKRVEQVIALPGQNKLVALCASTLCVYRLADLQPVGSAAFQPLRGVSCVALDERVPRAAGAEAAGLCVACLRSIRLYQLTADDVRLEHEFSVASGVACLSHYGNFVCLADDESYKIVDLRKKRAGADDDAELPLLPTQQPHTDPETGRVVRPPRPRTLVVGANEFMFLTSSGADPESDTLGVIVTALGEARRGTLQFAAYPKSVVYDDPFVIAVFASGRVEVHDTTQPDATLVQTFAFADSSDAARPKRLCGAVSAFVATETAVCETIDTDAANIAALGGLQEQELKRDVVEMEGLPNTEPGKPLSSASSVRVVAVAADSLYFVAREPPVLRVAELIDGQRIEEAMAIVDAAQHQQQSGTTAETQFCIQLAAVTCLGSMLLDDALQYFRRGLLDPRALLHLFPDLVRYLGPLLVPFARIPMPRRLRAAFIDIGDVDALIARGSAQLLAEHSSAEQAEALAAALMANTLEVLERYLRSCRSLMRANGYNSLLDRMPFAPDAVPVVDTALARLYATNARHDRLCTLLQDPASAVVGDLAAGYFRDSGYYYYYSLVLKAEGSVRQVLDAWRSILTGEWPDERFGGVDEYLQYVVLTDSQSIMLEEFTWLTFYDVDAALRLLAHLADGTVEQIDADQVFVSIEAQGDRPMRVFIERLLTAKHPRASHYMTYLVSAYVRQICEHHKGEESHRSDTLVRGYKRAQADDLRLRFRAYLSDASVQSDTCAALHTRLLGILADRQPQYDVDAVCKCLNDEEQVGFVDLERAVVLVIMGNIDDALDVLVNQLGDYAEAEMLLVTPDNPQSLACLAPNPLSSGVSSVNRLLRMYLDLSKSHNDDEMSARLVTDLLHRYADDLGPDILADIPDHWPLSIVQTFVSRHLQLLKAQEQASNVQRSLNQAMAFASKVDYTKAVCDRGPVKLDYTQTCCVCNKLLGSSVFVFEAETGDIKHISCT